MLSTVILLVLLPALATCAGEGNIRLLQEEVAAVLKFCAESDVTLPQVQREKRFADDAPRIDDNTKPESNPYSHERRNVTDMKDQTMVLNATNSDYDGYGSGNMGEMFVNSVPKMAAGGNYPDVNMDGSNRTRRSEPLLNKPENEQVGLID